MTMLEKELGWVIERGDSSPSSPTYWSGPDYWSQDHMDAVRFSRKQDAERVACRLHGGYHRICEHGWVNNPTPPAVEASDLERARNLLADDPDDMDEAWLAGIIVAIRREAAQGHEKELEEALCRAREIIANAYREPTEREKELTAALRKIAALDRYSGSSLRSRAASEIARAVLAKATERGL